MCKACRSVHAGDVLFMPPHLGAIFKLGDLTTDELLPAACPSEGKLLRLAGEVARRAGGVSHPRIIPQGKQNGHYGRRKGNKTAIMAAARETKRPLWPPQGKQKGRYALAR